MKKRILITEDEKKYIKNLYGILNEQNKSASTETQDYTNNVGAEGGLDFANPEMPYCNTFCKNKGGTFPNMKQSLSPLIGRSISFYVGDMQPMFRSMGIPFSINIKILDLIDPNSILKNTDFQVGMKVEILDNKLKAFGTEAYVLFNCCQDTCFIGSPHKFIIKNATSTQNSNFAEKLSQGVSVEIFGDDKIITDNYCLQWKGSNVNFVTTENKPFKPVNVKPNVLEIINELKKSFKLKTPPSGGYVNPETEREYIYNVNLVKKLIGYFEVNGSKFCSLSSSDINNLFNDYFVDTLEKYFVDTFATDSIKVKEVIIDNMKKCPKFACTYDFVYTTGVKRTNSGVSKESDYLIKSLPNNTNFYKIPVDNLGLPNSSNYLSERNNGTWYCDNGIFTIKK